MFIEIALSKLSIGPSVGFSLNMQDILLALLPIGAEEWPRFVSVIHEADLVAFSTSTSTYEVDPLLTK